MNSWTEELAATAPEMVEDFDQTSTTCDEQSPLENGSEWGFRLSNHGVEWRDDSGDAPEWRQLCDPIEVAADTRDAGSENWGRLLVFKDRDGVRHEWAAAAADLSRTQSGEVIAHLARLGIVPPVSQRDKNRLVEYLVTARPTARLRAVGRVPRSVQCVIRHNAG